MIAIDTNVLVHAHRSESPSHAAATAALAQASRSSWAIPWPCIHEFIAIVTHPRIFNPPSSVAAAILAVESWLTVPNLSLLGETDAHWATLSDALRASGVAGPRVHDARIAAICRQHGVSELWTADRDFSRFPGLVTRNPLVSSG